VATFDEAMAIGQAYETHLGMGDDAEACKKKRRKQGSHYTPAAMAAQITARTLEPIFLCTGPDWRRVKELKVCDFSCGGAAFLLQAVKQVGEELHRCFDLDGKTQPMAMCLKWAAFNCTRGVDLDAGAVDASRRAVGAYVGVPPEALEHAIKHGDALLGLQMHQLRAFHWDPASKPEEDDVICRYVDACIARSFLEVPKLFGDLVIGAFFSSLKKRERSAELARRRALVTAWIDGGERIDDSAHELKRLRDEFRAPAAEPSHTRVPFHWPLEFPDVFLDPRRVDPLAADPSPSPIFVRRPGQQLGLFG
jgi:hypothetical protein